MNSILVKKTTDVLKGEIILPGSKSESNRALIMQALCKQPFEIQNLSIADDTVTLEHLLKTEIASQQTEINVGPAGTAMRFLTALLSVTPGEWLLTGTHRMLERPIKLLVDALRNLGADIEYTGNEGFPPLKIKGKDLNLTNEISIDGSVSSQYISALLMIAPTLPNGLVLNLTGVVASRPYIEMTLAMMAELGIEHSWTNNTIGIKNQPYQANDLFIEPDWSGSSYWYSLVALSKEANIKLTGLKDHSLQGDSVISKIMEDFGVKTDFLKDGINLTKTSDKVTVDFIDFEHCPDIAQTLAVICAGLGHNCTFTGLESLKIKETDRVAALQNELGKYGVTITQEGLNYHIDCSKSSINKAATDTFINTYHDHRMAMAFAPLVLKVNSMEIEDPKVTGKSYPHFWEDLEKIGFECTQSELNTTN
ncbi:3-phosphoshikimate 1-carboxyvinyltransferase [Solitalea sp. MAHUQ-68]|uniref:3-phosphoshikimate 1-carboxyvinyltransferase n=1 Tax=Solitalea agri TaxID=2953739 RepID=A0A9X2F0H4_9SPHI|nr:3-phosphoshikimate 1-carboxyvinyltransferase [Solitalea agri]MCO4292347.1 3-phosphoshikimate 1-carboxyvinyltransferase [Solitalea agri]